MIFQFICYITLGLEIKCHQHSRGQLIPTQRQYDLGSERSVTYNYILAMMVK